VKRFLSNYFDLLFILGMNNIARAMSVRRPIQRTASGINIRP